MEKPDKNRYQRRSVHSEMEKLDVGGLLKNEVAAWVRGYMINLGTCPVEAALGNPIWIENGVDSRYSRVIQESDCIIYVQCLKGMGESSTLFDALIMKCKD